MPPGKAPAVGTPGGLFPLDFRGKPPAPPGLSAHIGPGVRVVNQDHRMKFTPRRRRLAPPCMAAGAIVGMDHTITLPCLAVEVWAAMSRGLDKGGIVRVCDQRSGNLKGRRFDPSPCKFTFIPFVFAGDTVSISNCIQTIRCFALGSIRSPYESTGRDNNSLRNADLGPGGAARHEEYRPGKTEGPYLAGYRKHHRIRP